MQVVSGAIRPDGYDCYQYDSTAEQTYFLSSEMVYKDADADPTTTVIGHEYGTEMSRRSLGAYD